MLCALQCPVQDVRQGRCLHHLQVDAPLLSCNLLEEPSGSGQYLVAAGADGGVHFIDCTSGERLGGEGEVRAECWQAYRVSMQSRPDVPGCMAVAAAYLPPRRSALCHCWLHTCLLAARPATRRCEQPVPGSRAAETAAVRLPVGRWRLAGCFRCVLAACSGVPSGREGCRTPCMPLRILHAADRPLLRNLGRGLCPNQQPDLHSRAGEAVVLGEDDLASSEQPAQPAGSGHQPPRKWSPIHVWQR